MIRHLLRLVWNRKRSNVLIAAEILLSFLVLTAVTTLVVFYVDNYGQPLGFEVDNRWVFTVAKRSVNNHRAESTDAAPKSPSQLDGGWMEQRARTARLLSGLRSLTDVEAVAAASIVPYSANATSDALRHRGRVHTFGLNAVTDGFADAMGLTLTAGRWFSSEDDGAEWLPVVVNARLAGELFPGEHVVGQYVGEKSAKAPRRRIVGVVQAFRKDGEYLPAENYMFERVRLDDPNPEVRAPRELLVRVRPGTTAAFEERAVALLRSMEPDWSFQAESLVRSRETALRLWLAPVTAAGVVAVFLLSMVALGLTGVLWLHITQRTREIGLRRAKGATRAAIQRQFVGEVAILTLLAVGLGTGVVVQFPLLDVFGAVRPGVYALGLTVSFVMILTLTLACAWVPSRVGSAVEPADALRYE